MKKVFAGLLIATFGTVSVSAQEERSDWTIGVKASTLGAGLEVRRALSDSFAVRLGGNLFDLSFDGSESGINYDFDVDLKSANLLIDYHPFKGNFRLTGGVLWNDNEAFGVADTENGVRIGNIRFTQEQIGDLTGDITVNEFAPYLGLGWGKALGKSGWGFSAELGAVFTGKPEVRLQSANGEFSSNPILLGELRREEQDLQDELDRFEVYPVVSVGLSYSF